MLRVLFVCLGNICRSPMADAVFQQMVQDAGLSDAILVDSAGTGGWHVGEKAHPGTLGILRRQAISYEGRARQLKPTDLQSFNYILAMDRNNLRDIQTMSQTQENEVALFLSYANRAGIITETEVPDPYYTGEYDYVYQLVAAGSQALLDHIRQQHAL